MALANTSMRLRGVVKKHLIQDGDGWMGKTLILSEAD